MFISFRFAEAHAEAIALRDELEARSIATFVSDESPGRSVQAAITKAMGEASLHVLMATTTYGCLTNPLFSTRQELNYSVTNGNPFLINMTGSNDPVSVWTETATQAALIGVVWQRWDPGKPLQPELVDAIVARL